MSISLLAPVPAGNRVFVGYSGNTYTVGPNNLINNVLATDVPALISQGCSIPTGSGTLTQTQGNALYARTGLPTGPLAQFKRAYNNALSGTANCRIMCAGDSITVGYLGAGPGTQYAAARPFSYPHIMTNLMKAAGIPATDDNFTGDGNVGSASTTLQQYDSRITGGVGWATNLSANNAMGGNFINSNATTNVVNFTPTGGAFDTIEVSYGTTSGAGAANVAVDGGATVGTFSCNASNGIGRSTFTVPLGTHTVNITPQGTGTVYVSGIVCYNSTQGNVIVQTGAGGGALTSQFTSSPYGGPAYYALPNPPDLTVYLIGANDLVNATGTSTYSSSLTASVAAMRAYGGDVVLVTWPQPATSRATTINNNAYKDVMNSFASQLIPIIDINKYWGLYTLSNSQGLMNDTVHPSAAGYGVGTNSVQGIAQLMYNYLFT